MDWIWIGFVRGANKWILGRKKASFFQVKNSLFLIFVGSSRSEDFQDSGDDDLVDPMAPGLLKYFSWKNADFQSPIHFQCFLSRKTELDWIWIGLLVAKNPIHFEQFVGREIQIGLDLDWIR